MAFSKIDKKKITDLRTFAEGNITPLNELLEIIDGKRAPVGDDPRFAINIKAGRVVFNIEQQPKCFTRHMSISNPEEIDKKQVDQVLKALGFQDANHIMVYPEGPAFNFIEPTEKI